MSETINFIPANELPEAEGEQVEVLCLENGEMKRKPGASMGGGEPLLCRTYTSADIVLSSTSERFIVDEEIVRAVFQSINHKTKMPYICLFVNGNAYFPQNLKFGFGTALNAEAFEITDTSIGSTVNYYVFDTYDHAYEYYDR